MKLNTKAAAFIPRLATAHLTAADSIRITNTKHSEKHWTAVSVWNRSSDIRGIDASDDCRHRPELPYAEWTEVCFDWYTNRGHWVEKDHRKDASRRKEGRPKSVLILICRLGMSLLVTDRRTLGGRVWVGLHIADRISEVGYGT